MGTAIMHSGREFAGGGAKVVPNPVGTPTDDLETVKINNTIYNIPGTTIEANPSGTATDDLDKIQIGNTIYDISSGGGGTNLELEINNGSIQATYGSQTEETEDILRDDTGQQITNLLDDIAEAVNLLGNPEVLAPIIYSTTEREVGVWTDGKPLYQKTVFFDSLSSSYSLSLGVSNIEYAFLVPDGSWANNSTRPIPYIIGTNNNNNIGGYFNVTSSDTSFEFRLGSGSASDTVNGCITFRYTKTTDTPGSGKYTALGTPAVHYSTAEQVVGTWIDGKTLYQKTIQFALTATSRIGDAWYYGGVSYENLLPSNMEHGWFINGYYDAGSGIHRNIMAGEIEINSSELLLYVNYSRSNVNAVATFQYTKTTD